MGPPDHEERERFAVGPPDKRSNAENALKQQLFLIPLSVSSVVGLGPGRGSFTWGNARKMSNLHGGSCFGAFLLGPLGRGFGFPLGGSNTRKTRVFA